MNVPRARAADGEAAYLDVRYAEALRPYTDYPSQLVSYLTHRYLSGQRGKKLPDLGSGRGEFLHHFAREGFDAVGMDRSRPASPKYAEPVVVGDYAKDGLPFRDGELSVIFNKSVLEHVVDPSPLLGECHRVLAPGGTLLSLVPDFRAQWRHFYDDWTHVRPFTLPGLRECVACHGFVVREAARFRQLPFLWKRPWLRPIADVCTLLPNAFKSSKVVRFSKEWMLLVVAEKP
ncbi:MAG TPA: class I SAM-dependent methyltransferase [Polyangiaceae bacterium]